MGHLAGAWPIWVGVLKGGEGSETVCSHRIRVLSTLYIAMAYGDSNDFGWCNLVVKFLLFITNVIVWVRFCVFLKYGL